MKIRQLKIGIRITGVSPHHSTLVTGWDVKMIDFKTETIIASNGRQEKCFKLSDYPDYNFFLYSDTLVLGMRGQ